MLLRVEENIIYLTPCKTSYMGGSDTFTALNKATIALHPTEREKESHLAWSIEQSSLFSAGAFVPSAGQVQSANSSKSGSESFVPTSPSNESFSNSLYHSSAGSFDNYYSSVLSALLNIITSDVSANSSVLLKRQSSIPNSSLPLLPPRWTSIQNLTALSIVVELLQSNKVSLVIIGVRICYALLKCSTKNVVALELAGVVAALVKLMVSIAISGRVGIRQFESYESTNRNQNQTNLHFFGYGSRSTLSILSDVVTVLKMVSIITSRRDVSIMAVITTTMLSCTLNSNEKNSPLNISASKASEELNDGAMPSLSGLRCQNCETEVAKFECLNEGYVVLNFYFTFFLFRHLFPVQVFLQQIL